ncbi:ABC-2 transporter permease [Lysinibacillus boronitolerans]|uniref:Transporter n=1 Tax=Lysinibacillus boronitolerans JCM 21713 = 10a = NBRC 103108 TaxID=1294264 RepID=A0ABR4XUW2_9BACI|nr:ABC-2 transporter permease [Lysinibacillus boronitolerans]KGR81372.1 transporter [Lysinibacillus boronitolerans JCM 21713 = 10a = NBRC 103108]
MVGLILKDLMTIQRQMKAQAFVLVFLLVMAIFMQQSSMLLAIIVFIVTIQAITALSYDEQSKWDKYANTLPISKADIVFSKYILSVMLMIIGLVMALPILFFINFFTNNETEFFLTFNLIVTLALCSLAVLLPIYIKFGSIKGRIVLIALCFIPGFLTGMFKEYIPDMPQTFLYLKQYVYLTPFGGLLLLCLSSLVSTAIYKRKEF